jgi:hypothetical protein
MLAEFLGFIVGVASGLVLTSRIGDRRPDRRTLGAVTTAMAGLAIAAAVPLRGMADVRPEMARVLDIEGRTVPVYRTAEARLSKGQIGATMVADLIELKILPELQAESDRLAALRGVPREHEQMVADAKEYVQLRYESWRLRAEGLRRTAAPPRRDASGAGLPDSTWRHRAETEHRVTQVMLGRAEGTERASLEALRRLKPSDPVDGGTQ